MRQLSFTQKLWLPMVVSLIAFAALSVHNAYSLREAHFSERKLALQYIGESAVSIIKEYGEQAAAGEITVADAQKQAMARVKAMRYGGKDGYITILGKDGLMIMHPINAALIGKKTIFPDVNGKPLFASVAEVGSQPGGGYVDYRWARVGATEPVLKTAYAVGYEPWGWMLFTGVYVDDIDTIFRDALLEAGILCIIFAAVFALIATPINRGIQRLLGGDPAYAVDIADRISRNDLALIIDVKKGDERSLLYSMKRMRDSLTGTIGAIQDSAHIIDTASREIAAGNLDLSSRTEQQAGSLEETASAMEELTSTVGHNANNARQANQLALAASEIAGKGGEVVKDVIATMHSINDSSKKIVDIIGVIDGIAFQTNILALNAAVEAARAGQEGRGFAVVASEVRSLAQRSADAAKEIKVLIDDSVSKVIVGTRLVTDAGSTMTEILQSVKNVASIVGEISVASQEQSTGIAEIGRAVTLMDESTQQNAAQVEQAAAAAQSMQDQAAELARLVGCFKLNDAGVADGMDSGQRTLRTIRSVEAVGFNGMG